MSYKVISRVCIERDRISSLDEALSIKQDLFPELRRPLWIEDESGNEWTHSKVKGWLNCSNGKYNQ